MRQQLKKNNAPRALPLDSGGPSSGVESTATEGGSGPGEDEKGSSTSDGTMVPEPEGRSIGHWAKWCGRAGRSCEQSPYKHAVSGAREEEALLSSRCFPLVPSSSATIDGWEVV